MKVKSSSSKQHPLPVHIQYYLPLQTKHDLRHATNLVWIWLRHRGGCRHFQNRALHQHCPATNQLPKGPASPDGSLKAKAKCETIIQCKIHQARACKHLNTSETETYLRIHTLKMQDNCITTSISTSCPIHLHSKQRSKGCFRNVIFNISHRIKREFQIRLSYSAINNKIIKLSKMLSLDCRRSQEIFGLEPSEVWTEPKRASEGTLHFINTSSVCLHSAKQYTHFC